MSATIVRYRVKPGRAEENAELVRAVYAELATVRPPGLRYATWCLEDGLTFVHVALTADGAESPLTGLAAFRRFQAGLAERCDEPPAFTRMTTPIGSYGL